MEWKKSDDGGLDYDVKPIIDYEKAKEKMFNPCATGYSSTMNFNFEPLPEPLSLKQRIKSRIKNYGRYAR